MEEIKRRDFIKLGALTVSTVASLTAISGVEVLSKAAQAKGEVLWGMVIDLTKCVRCGRCVRACHDRWFLPEDMFFNKMMKVRVGVREYELPAACMHCRNPPCLYACPTGATYKREDGIVEVDYSKCIGCKYCVAACPYLARVPMLEDTRLIPKGVVAKCNFCADRIDTGSKPACVEACPFNARIFGNLKDPNSEISHVLWHSRQVITLKEELGTQPTWYYILG